MFGRPQHDGRTEFFAVLHDDIADYHRLDLTGRNPKDIFHGPGKFQIDPGIQGLAADNRSEPFPHPQFARTDFRNAGEQPEKREPQQDRRQDRTFKETVDPGFGNLETELVIQRIGDIAHDPAGFGEDRKQTAFVNRTVFHLIPGPVKFAHETQQQFDAQHRERENRNF